MPNKYAKDTKKFTFYAKDPMMEMFIDDHKEKNNKQSKKQRGQIKKDSEKSEELLNDFGIGEGDIDNIFDLIAKEHPEI